MYLLNAEEVASAFTQQQQQPGVRTGSVGDISRYGPVLKQITSRVEELLEIGSLARHTTVDYFDITGRRSSEVLPRVLRLSDRFLSTDPLDTLFTNSLDAPYRSVLDVDDDLGVVYTDTSSGRFKLTYVAGFTADADGVFVGTPEWLKSIAIAAYQLQIRLTTGVSSIPDNVSYGDLLPAVRQELYTRVTKRPEKPRVGAWFPTRSVRSAAPAIIVPDPDQG